MKEKKYKRMKNINLGWWLKWLFNRNKSSNKVFGRVVVLYSGICEIWILLKHTISRHSMFTQIICHGIC